MWPLVAIVAVVGAMVYELWNRPKAAAEIAQAARDAARKAEADVHALAAGPPVAADRAKMCGLLATDYAATDQWTRPYLGAALPVPERLKLMLSVHSYATWPDAAKRVYCAYVQELAPTQFPGPHAHWGG